MWNGKSQEIDCHLGCSSGFDFPSKYAWSYLINACQSPRMFALCILCKDFHCNLWEQRNRMRLIPSQCSWNREFCLTFFFQTKKVHFLLLVIGLKWERCWFLANETVGSVCLELLGERFLPDKEREPWGNAALPTIGYCCIGHDAWNCGCHLTPWKKSQKILQNLNWNLDFTEGQTSQTTYF